MARDRAISVDNNFSGGLITEASGLNFPENACTQAENCVFDFRGPVSRRPPLDYENGFSTKTVDRTNSVVTSYAWKNVSGDGSVTFYVLQVGATLYFYRSVSGSISTAVLSSTVDLTTFSPSGAPSPKTNECQFSSGLGYLFGTHPNLNPFYVTYDSTLDTVTAASNPIQIRDHVGITEAVAVDNRPSSLTDTHKYNLQNQGWYTTSRITDFHTAIGTYPSNADVWWIFKNVSDEFDVTMIPHFELGSAHANQGHYVLNAFSQDRAAASGIAGLSVVNTSFQRPSMSAFFAGRVFYSGVNYPGWESRILFSQIIETVSQTGNCYQAADPTSETVFAEVASDGGYFTIPGAGSIVFMSVLGKYLIVGAANGVWAVTGSLADGFTANDFRVDQISPIGVLSGRSYVDAKGTPLYWTMGGIYTINTSTSVASVRALDATNLTATKIGTFYDDIPLQSRTYARGVFHPTDLIVYWLYRSTEAGGLEDIYTYDRVLCYNVLTGSFSPWVLTNTVNVHTIFMTGDTRSGSVEETVVTEAAATVVAEDTTTVTILATTRSLDQADLFFFTSSGTASSASFTVALRNSSRATYQDWGAVSATAFSSFFVTGYRLRTQGAKPFQSSYLNVFADVSEEDTDCTVRALWDFGNTVTPRWSNPQRIFAQTGTSDIVRRRPMIRGQGEAVQFRFDSKPGKGFNIPGWTVYDTSNQSI